MSFSLSLAIVGRNEELERFLSHPEWRSLRNLELIVIDTISDNSLDLLVRSQVQTT